MKDALKNNKKIITVSIFILILLLLGIAFAYLVTTINGKKEYLVRAGSLGLRLEESNELTLEVPIPIEDSEGLKLDGFNFDLINDGSIETDYTIYLDDIALDSGEERMADSAIRYSLTKDNVAGSPKDLESMGTNPNRVVDEGRIGTKQTIKYTLRVWLDYDATTEEASGKVFKAKLRVVAKQSTGETVSEAIVSNLGENGFVNTDDPEQTFIAGENPNNYVWYSGKLWRAVSIDTSDNSVKLITEDAISALAYSTIEENNKFSESQVKMWLNDTSVDGFLGNLREPEKFIKMDSKWNSTLIPLDVNNMPIDEPIIISKPAKTTITEAPVGLLNIYEYVMTNKNDSFNREYGPISYLNKKYGWFALNEGLEYDGDYAINGTWVIFDNVGVNLNVSSDSLNVRPVINLKNTVKVSAGSGTVDNPYRLTGDSDSNLNSKKLNTRYSGEYVKIGTGDNSLFRIVSHEDGNGTKITSNEGLKEGSRYYSFSPSNDLKYWLETSVEGDNLLPEELTNLVNPNSTWYLGQTYETCDYGDCVSLDSNYWLAKYKDKSMTDPVDQTFTSKYGLLRFGELMTMPILFESSNFDAYYLLNKRSESVYYAMGVSSLFDLDETNTGFLKIAIFLKPEVIITGGEGTKQNPFTVSMP